MTKIANPPLNGANRYAHIDAMRAFAVLLVVVAHAGLGNIIPGGSGVTVFFSISGFIITYLLLREKDKTGGFSASHFYWRRAVKIAPPFIFVIILPSVISSLWVNIDWLAFLSQMFFVFNWVYIQGDTAVLDGSDVVWSLSIEEQFYIVFALFWLVAVKSKYWRPALMAVAVMGVVYATTVRVFMASNPALGDRIYYGSDTRLDGIAWGVIAAVTFHWLQERERIHGLGVRVVASDWAFIGALGIYLFSLVYRDEWFRDTFRYTLQSLAACIVILYGLLPGGGPFRRILYSVSQWRLVSLVGLSSYSIYLVHLVLMNYLRDLLNVPMPVSVAVLSLIGIGAGMVVYQLIEVPAHNWSLRIRQNRRLTTGVLS